MVSGKSLKGPALLLALRIIVLVFFLLIISGDAEEQLKITDNITAEYIAERSGKDRLIIQFYDEPVLIHAARSKAEIKRKQNYIKELEEKYSFDSGNKSLKSQIEKEKLDIEKRKVETNNTIKGYKNNILIKHSNIKNKFKKKNINIKIVREYYNILNGFAVEALREDTEKLKIISDLKAIYTDQKVNLLLTESVPLINATGVWQLQDASGENITGKDIKIAIIDTGIDYTHPDLGNGFGPGYKVIAGWDFYNNDANPMDDNGHGTHVAGIAAANGSLKGIAPGACLMAYKVLDFEGNGLESLAIAGIEMALDPDRNPVTDDGANILSLSIGGPGDPDGILSQAVDNAVDYGSVVVVAAGNSGPSYETINSPGTARKAITVGATDKSNSIAYFSSRGPVVWNGGSILKPDVVAPGVSIYSTVPAGSCKSCSPDMYRIKSGTSMATPMVAGTAALLMQINPEWDPIEVKMALRGSSEYLAYDMKTQGYGRINALKAAILNAPPPVPILKTSGNVRNTMDILGTAEGYGFANYTVEYGTGNGTWWSLGTLEDQVNDGILINDWDTTKVEDGEYFLRLTVKSNSGLSSIDQTLIKIKNVLTVCASGCDYTIIQDAIDHAGNGSTIKVKSGTYYENIKVYKKIILQGDGEPVVDAGRTGNAITLSKDGTRLEGFIVTNSSNWPYAGINAISNNNIISGNTIVSNRGFGLRLFSSSNNTLMNNTLTNNIGGIYILDSSDNNLIKDSIITNNQESGITLDNSRDNNITGNAVSHNSDYGIHLDSSTNNNIFGNILSDNLGGIVLSSSSDNTLMKNTALNNHYGIYLYSSHDNQIYNNYFSNARNAHDNGNNIWNLTRTNGKNIIGGPYYGGNFWADPDGTGFSQTCIDSDSDGICDSNYTMGSGRVDHLPLTFNTKAGTNVRLEFKNEGIKIYFSEVTQTGQTTVTVLPMGPATLDGFKQAGNFFYVTTNASYNASITICINYDDSQVSDKSNLKLLSWNGTGWKDVTTSPDTIENIICGMVTNLSTFVVADPVFSDVQFDLSTGWNLISIPLNLTSFELGEESVAGNPLNVFPVNCISSIYRYNTTSGLFEKSDHFPDYGWWPATGSESFTELEPGRGYWAMSEQDCELTFTGTAPSDLDIPLEAGWNLIGWYSMNEGPFGEEAAVGNPLNVTPANSLSSIYGYNTSSGFFEKSDHFDNWGWWPATGSESFTAMEPGRGYWVMAQDACKWEHNP